MLTNDRLIDKIKISINKYFPNYELFEIVDRGQWIRRIFEVKFNKNFTIFYKIITHEDWSDNIQEVNVSKIFSENNLPIPKLLVVDDSCSLIDYPYIVQEKVGGIKLGELIKRESKAEIVEIYEEIGRIYRKIHRVKNKISGLWSENPYEVRYPVSPNDYMFYAEIENGSGKKALEEKFISQSLYDNIVELWKSNLNFLKDHQPSMVHVSPFIWNIYLDKIDDKWQVTKLMSLGDVIWWDPYYDLAAIKYPPFVECSSEAWNGFLKGYQEEIDEKRILLYALMHKLCGCMGVYLEPKVYHNEEWIKKSFVELEDIVKRLNDMK